MFKKTKVLVLSLLVSVSSVFFTSSIAIAGASGCNYWGVYYVKLVPVPQGKYCVGINGSGKTVNALSGQFTSYIKVCNWNITAEFFDSSNRWYKTFESSKQYSCTFTGTYGLVMKYTAKKGYVCSTLKQNGSRLTSWCATIF